jgi:hypothetical protein
MLQSAMVEVGRVMAGSWKNIRRNLEEYWVEVKRIGWKLEEYWAEIGRILVEVGNILGKNCVKI